MKETMTVAIRNHNLRGGVVLPEGRGNTKSVGFLYRLVEPVREDASEEVSGSWSGRGEEKRAVRGWRHAMPSHAMLWHAQGKRACKTETGATPFFVFLIMTQRAARRNPIQSRDPIDLAATWSPDHLATLPSPNDGGVCRPCSRGRGGVVTPIFSFPVLAQTSRGAGVK